MAHLPSLPALELFVRAARLESVSRAAEKAGMTQSAASRRIAALEADLGVVLFDRRRHGVTLTEAGRRFLAQVEPAIAAITDAVAGTRAHRAQAPFRLRVYSTFAARWLLPRLPDFQRRHPEVRVVLDATVTPAAPDPGEVDLAIRFCDAESAGSRSWLLMEDEIEPVCTAEFARRHGIGPGRTHLDGIPLLESHYRSADWGDWARMAGCSLAGVEPMYFPNSMLAYQAAIAGLGIAMGQTWLLDGELNDGLLIKPFDRPLRRALAYFLVAPKGPESPQAKAFRRWIMTCVGRDTAA
jgi:LysR family glycine cleavage system transcriptional activator